MIRRVTLTALLAPGVALAHPGHGGHALWAAFTHPFSGLDHLLMLLAVGVVAARGDRAAALAALGGLAFGLLAAAHLSTGPLAAVEWAVLAGTALATALAVGLARLPSALTVALLATFGLAHGFAHGVELSAAALPATLAGATLGAATLTLLGYVAARAMQARRASAR